ncbi:MAG: MOSC domain-containing protein [Myxococcales bacterium]|nr:MOSC domain-containing protein [Myxococcales bacterium]
MPRVSSLHIYPIKSCRGLDLKAVRFDMLGPAYDRRFMLVDGDGCFLTQREESRLALVEPALGPTSLQVKAPGMPVLKIGQASKDARRLEVSIWKDRGEAEDVGEHAASWFSQFLGRPCRLVRFPEGAVRPVDPDYARFDAATALADGFPVLLTTTASLEQLNQRLQPPVPMNRFRPNVVVEDCEPFAEDSWRQIRIGELVLDVVKPCARCTMVNVDQLRGRRLEQPLSALAEFRKRDNEVFFGQNCIHHSFGSIRVGDEVEVLESNPKVAIAGEPSDSGQK